MPVKTGAGTVVSHSGPGIGVGGGFLHVPERHAGVQGGGGEGVAQGVGPDGLGDPCAAGDPADDAPGAVPVQPPPVRRQEQRPGLEPGRLGQFRPQRLNGDPP